MFQAIINKIAARYIQKHLDAPREVVASNLQQAKTIGIIYNASDKVNYLEYKRLANLISEYNPKAEMKALGWYRGKRKPEFLSKSTVSSFFGKSDYGTFYKPKKSAKELNLFIETPFDVLIDLTRNDIFPLRRVLAMSKARFKVGQFTERNEPFYEFMIKCKTAKEFISQAVYYLKLINKDAA